ncbi:unnamed protein product, partial [Prorocentrum cordatum]
MEGLPVDLQGSGAPPPVAGDQGKFSDDKLVQLISLHRKMGNEAQANQVDRHIKQLEKKLQHDLEQYTKWSNWRADKKESVGAVRRELAGETQKHQGMVDQLRAQVCPAPATPQKRCIALQDLLDESSDFLDMGSVEEVFGVDGSVYEVQGSDAQEFEKRTTQLKESIQKAARQLSGE